MFEQIPNKTIYCITYRKKKKKSIIPLPGTKVPPLKPINRSQVTLLPLCQTNTIIKHVQPITNCNTKEKCTICTSKVKHIIMLAHQGILWMHCHPIYECFFPVAPAKYTLFSDRRSYK